MNENFEFDDVEDLNRALSGEYGPEWQQAAEVTVQQLEAQEREEAEQGESEEEEKLIDAIGESENRTGRTYTMAEMKGLARKAKESGSLDFRPYEAQLAKRDASSSGREEIGLEAARNVIRESERDEPEDEVFIPQEAAHE